MVPLTSSPRPGINGHVLLEGCGRLQHWSADLVDCTEIVATPWKADQLLVRGGWIVRGFVRLRSDVPDMLVELDATMREFREKPINVQQERMSEFYVLVTIPI